MHKSLYINRVILLKSQIKYNEKGKLRKSTSLSVVPLSFALFSSEQIVLLKIIITEKIIMLIIEMLMIKKMLKQHFFNITCFILG